MVLYTLKIEADRKALIGQPMRFIRIVDVIISNHGDEFNLIQQYNPNSVVSIYL